MTNIDPLIDTQGPRRRIWLCADDYGLAPGVDDAIRDLVGRGRLNAVSVMVIAPSFTHAEADTLARLNAPRPRAAIGLHLTLTAPFRPLHPSWLARHGPFVPVGATLRRALARRYDATALRAEVEAQLSAFGAAFGRAPDFIDGHQHVHLFPQLREAVLAVAGRMAPSAWVRQCGQPRMSPERLRDPKGLLVGFLSRAFRRRAASRGVATNPAFAGTYSYAPGADFTRAFPRFLVGLPDGGLVMCHPGFVDAELRRLDPLTDLREREHAYLASDTFTQALREARVELAEPVQ